MLIIVFVILLHHADAAEIADGDNYWLLSWLRNRTPPPLVKWRVDETVGRSTGPFPCYVCMIYISSISRDQRTRPPRWNRRRQQQHQAPLLLCCLATTRHNLTVYMPLTILYNSATTNNNNRRRRTTRDGSFRWQRPFGLPFCDYTSLSIDEAPWHKRADSITSRYSISQ